MHLKYIWTQKSQLSNMTSQIQGSRVYQPFQLLNSH